MSWNVKCHKMSNVIKCQMSWNADARSMTPSRNTRSYTLRSVPRTVIFVINLLLTFVNVSLLILVKFSRLISWLRNLRNSLEYSDLLEEHQSPVKTIQNTKHKYETQNTNTNMSAPNCCICISTSRVILSHGS